MGLIFTPVFVFDQFEEVFNLPGSTVWTKKFFDWLEDVSSDSCPDEIVNKVREIIGINAAFPAIKEEKDFKAVFSLRKEFIGELDYWGMQKCFIPSLKDNRYCLKALTYEGAKKVMTQQKRFEEAKVEQVLRYFVQQYSREPEKTIAENLPVIPALLLSVVCDSWEKDIHYFSDIETYDIDSSLNRILAKFYDEAIGSVVNEIVKQNPQSGSADLIREDIETAMFDLVDVNGKRVRTKATTTLGTIRLAQAGNLRGEELRIVKYKKVLSEHRIIKISKVDDEDYVEIVHDALCPIIAKRKELYLAVEAKRREEEQLNEQANRLKKRILLMLAIVIIAIGGFAYISFQKRQVEKANRQMAEKQEKMLINQSRYIAEKALTTIDDGYIASLLALEALPGDLEKPNRPYVPEAEYALRRSLQNRNTVFKGHTSYVYDVAFSPDGNLLASASADQTIRIREVHSGVCLQILEGHEDGIYRIRFSPNGRHLVSASRDGTIRIWDLSNSNCVQILSGHSGHVNDVAFSPDGSKLVSCSDDSLIVVWDTNAIPVWSGPVCQTLLRLKHPNKVNTAQFSPDGQHILSASADSTIRIWSALSGDCKMIIRDEKPVVFAYYNSDGNKILSGARNSWRDKNGWVKVWSVKNGGVISVDNSFNQGLHKIRTALWGKDNNDVIILTESNIITWNYLEKNRYSSYSRVNAEYISAAMSPDGYTLAIGAENNGVYLNSTNIVDRPLELLSIEGGYDARFIANNTQIVSTGKKICNYWDSQTGRLLKSFDTRETTSYIQASSTGKYLLELTHEGVVIKDILSGEQVIMDGMDDDYHDFEFSSSDKYLLASGDYSVGVWDIRTGALIGIWEELGDIPIAAFFPDEKRIVSSSDIMGVYYIWDITTGLQKKIIDNYRSLIGFNMAATMISVSPNERYIAIGHGREPIEVIDLETEKLTLSFNEHHDEIKSILFSPNSNYLLTASDGGFYVWDVKLQQCLFSVDEDAVTASFSSDGKRILTTSEDYYIRVWDYQPLQQLIDKTRERFANRPLTKEERHRYYLE